MKGLVLTAVAIVVPGGIVVAIVRWLRRRQRRQAFWDGPNYRQQIEALAPKAPIALPVVRPLVGRVVVPAKHRENVTPIRKQA